MPRSLPFFLWDGEGKECSGGIHRTFQNKVEILSAVRIGVGLVLKSPSLCKGPETHFRGGEGDCCYI